jgi:hypothetical protein
MTAPLREVTATITPTGVLTVWGLDPDPQVIDEGALAAARNALINLLHQHAVTTGRPVRAAVRTPAGPWYMAVDPTGRCIPCDPAEFAGPPPELDPAATLAGIEAVLAAADTPQATLALASDPDPAIRSRALAEMSTWADDQALVAEAELPVSRLDVLARCDRAWVRAGVAANPLTAPGTLVDLVEDPDPSVRMALASRFDLDPSVMVLLAADPDARVAAALSRNPAAAYLAPDRSHARTTASDAGPAAPHTPGAARAEAPQDTAGPAAPSLYNSDDELADDELPGIYDIPADDRDGVAAAGRSRFVRALGTRRAVATGVAVVALIGAGGLAAATASSPADPPAETSSTETATASWNGMSLPAGPDGPTDPASPVAAGFAHTELGAAMAAAHLSVRIDAYAGPASFAPTITGQTSGGDSAALLAATRARYTAAAAAAGISGGAPIPTAAAQIVGWRIEGTWEPAAPATVHLRVTAGGSAADYAIQVVWRDGDYVLIDPTAPGNFTTTTAADPDRYRSF